MISASVGYSLFLYNFTRVFVKRFYSPETEFYSFVEALSKRSRAKPDSLVNLIVAFCTGPNFE